MNILKGYFEVIENILVEPIWIAFVLGFINPHFKFIKFKHDDMNAYETNCNQTLGLWQLTPTKQESRPEIQA